MARRDGFTEALGASVTDVRQKLVEEAWFGRTVTPRLPASSAPDAGSSSFAERLGWERSAGSDGPDRADRGVDH